MTENTQSQRHEKELAERRIRGGLPLLAPARLRQLRRARRPDRHHAAGPRGPAAMDLPGPLPPRPLLLHAPAGAGGAAARDLHRLAPARDVGRGRGRPVLRPPVGLPPLGALRDLRRVRGSSRRGGRLRGPETRRRRARRRGARQDRRPGPAPARARGDRSRRLRRDLRPARPLPVDRDRLRADRVPRRTDLAAGILRGPPASTIGRIRPRFRAEPGSNRGGAPLVAARAQDRRGRSLSLERSLPRPGPLARLVESPCSPVPLLHAGGLRDFRGRVRGPRLCPAGGRPVLSLDHAASGDRRSGPGRNDARPSHHGAPVRGLHDGLEPDRGDEPPRERFSRRLP